MDNLEVLYEDVAVTHHSDNSTLEDGVVMALYNQMVARFYGVESSDKRSK